ncbi:MAG: hypothetical protein ACYCTL_12745 [Acidimicrobiales bacterium]
MTTTTPKFRLADRATAPLPQLLAALERTQSERTAKMLRTEIAYRVWGHDGRHTLSRAEARKLIDHPDVVLATNVLQAAHQHVPMSDLLRLLEDPRESIAREARGEIVSRIMGTRRWPEWYRDTRFTPEQARKLIHHPDAKIAAAAVRCATPVLSTRTLRSLARSEQVEVAVAAIERGGLAKLGATTLRSLARSEHPEVAVAAIKVGGSARLGATTLRSLARSEHPEVAKLASDMLAEAAYAEAAGLSDDELLARLVADPKDATAWRVAAVRMVRHITGPTHFVGNYDASYLEVTDRQIIDGDALLLQHVEGWHYYSRRHPCRYRAASYIGGISGDGTGAWTARVSSSITAVTAALAELEPAAVRNAREKGKRVIRQGDLYAVETTPAHEGAYAPGRHEWDPTTRILTHPEHAAITIPYPVRFLEQTARAMRGAGSRGGD